MKVRKGKLLLQSSLMCICHDDDDDDDDITHSLSGKS
jgi:hypothetical protein